MRILGIEISGPHPKEAETSANFRFQFRRRSLFHRIRDTTLTSAQENADSQRRPLPEPHPTKLTPGLIRARDEAGFSNSPTPSTHHHGRNN